jgi:hypothetical protein
MLLYLRNANTDTGCDGATLPNDLSDTSGSGNVTASAASAGFSEIASWDVNVEADAYPGAASFDTTLDCPLVGAEAEFKWRLQAINASCAVVASTGYSATFSAAGVHSANGLTMTVPHGVTRLRLSLEGRYTGGTPQSVRVNTTSASTVRARFTPLLRSLTEALVARLKTISTAAGYHYDVLAESVTVGPMNADQSTSFPALAIVRTEYGDYGRAVLGDTKRQNEATARFFIRGYLSADNAQEMVIDLMDDALRALAGGVPRLGFDSNTVERLNPPSYTDERADDEAMKPYGMGLLVVEMTVRLARGRL